MPASAASSSHTRSPPPGTPAASTKPQPAADDAAKAKGGFVPICSPEEMSRRRAAVREAQKRLQETRIRIARRDGAAFNEFVLRKEKDNTKVRNAPCHERWHRDISEHRRVVLWAAIESAKTSSVSIGRALFELARNPSLRIAIVSETDGKAMKVLRAIKTIIRESRELRVLFPNLRRSKHQDEPWTAHAITVERNTRAKDPSIQVTGVKGSIIGSRVDLLILDDVLSHRTARTKGQREELLAWYQATLGGRLTAESRVIAVGTAWHEEDLMHHLSRTEGWFSRRYPVLDPATGLPTWPEVWPLDRIAKARIELGPIEAARQLDCQPVNDNSARFPKEFIDRALFEGDGLFAARSLAEMLEPGQELYEGAFFTTGIDVGASLKEKGSGLTVAVTILTYPNLPTIPTNLRGTRQVVSVDAGRMTGPQILDLARSHHQRYGSVVFVENNAAQVFLLQFAREGEQFPVLGHHTGANKWNPTYGVESIAVEMSQGRIALPNEHGTMEPEVAALVAEMRSYSPSDHTGDRLMALWIAREGARRMAPEARPTAGVRTFAPVDRSPVDELDDVDDVA